MRGSRIDKAIDKLLGKATPTFWRAPATGGTTLGPSCTPSASSTTSTETPEDDPLAPKPAGRAKLALALRVASSAFDLEQAVKVLKQGFFAETNQAPRAAREQEAERLLQAVVKCAASLKAAGYKSASTYLSVLKLLRVEKDFQVGPALQRIFDLCNRALKRGQGPAAKAPEVQLDSFSRAGKQANLRPEKVAFPLRPGAQLHAPAPRAGDAEGEGRPGGPGQVHGHDFHQRVENGPRRPWRI